ncbi:hypothetical protein [Anaerocaecibacter muris]|uniref:hypothetical protein n=1 Tax=Anaerocaecibacter muris TaxID=2941513 RepID=UPI003F69197F
MDNEKIIIDMLNRICSLEEQVQILMADKEMVAAKIGTADVKKYISELKHEALVSGKEYLVLTANDIHSALKLKNRMPIVCNAMKQSMTNSDIITHQTASGYTSTLTIKYYLE